MTPEFLSVAWVLIILCIQLTIGIHHMRVLPVSLGIFQGWWALFIFKIKETSLHMLLHLCRHITALVCQSGKKKILFIMCKENMTDTENSRVWKRWSRTHTKNFEWLNNLLRVGQIQSLLSWQLSIQCLWTLYHIILLHSVHSRLFTNDFNLSPLMPHWNFSDVLPLLLPSWLSPRLQFYLANPDPISALNPGLSQVTRQVHILVRVTKCQ